MIKQLKKILNNLPLSLIFASISLPFVFRNELNTDELCTVTWVLLDWKEYFNQLIADVHPPLYYIIIKLVLDITNQNLIIGRIFSLIPTFIYLYASSQFLKKEFNQKSSFYFFLFVTFLPCMVLKTTELRMYSIATLFVLLCAIQLYYLLKNATTKNWVLFTLFALLSAYTHYFCIPVMIILYSSIFIYFLIQRNWKNIKYWFLYSFLTIIGYLPWLGTAIKQITRVNEDFWITVPESRLGVLRELLYTSIPHTEKFFILIFVSVSFIGLLIFILTKNIIGYIIITYSFPLWMIIAFGIWYGEHVRPLMVSRYLIMPVCLLILGGSIAINFVPKYIRIPILFVILFIGIILYKSHYNNLYNSNVGHSVSFVKDNINDSLIVIAMDQCDDLIARVQYYQPDCKWIHYKDINLLHNDYSTIWYYDTFMNLNEYELEQNGITVQNCGIFSFGYSEEFIIYKLSRY